MTTADQTNQAAATETTEATPEVAVTSPTLTTTQEINALRATHEFFSNFDRVPGFAASQWSQALDTIAVVANSLINKTNGKTPDTENAVDAASADSTVTQ
jgi:hypothetical protein